MLKEQSTKEVTRSILILFIDHKLIEIYVGSNICPKLNTNHGIVHSSTGIRLLLNCADLDRDLLDRKDASHQKFTQQWLHIKWDTAPFIKKQPYTFSSNRPGDIPQCSCYVRKVQANSFSPAADLA